MIARFRVFIASIVAAAALGSCVAAAQTDLDAFMREVLARRDDNWKKLQQYVLDERERFQLNGPDKMPIWGERREYTWYIRDGFFVRSPVKFNGVTVSESERQKAEADYLKRAQEMDRRRGGRGQRPADPAIARGDDRGAGAPGSDGDSPQSVESFIKQSRQPEFVSSAYFLRFKFEQGKYALVGRETIDGRELLRIEYYPARLFGGTDRRRRDPKAKAGKTDAEKAKERAYDAEFERLMNKVALVTLWVEPKAHQIVKYHFQNLPFDFFPASWLVHVDQLDATMTMGQPFPDVWLPQSLSFAFEMSLAIGPIDARYDVEYHDYKQADVTTKVKIR
ncbi:MAG TPA: hypothetical protein VEU08_01055 [Vicinamibacterales bacterium]|nr:hypothetical protein [Vicinamibacterales bacterium]